MSCASVTSNNLPQHSEVQSFLGESSYPAHRIAFAAFQALSRCEIALENNLYCTSPWLLQECTALAKPYEKLLALKIIQMGLKKHQLLDALEAPSHTLQHCDQCIEGAVHKTSLQHIDTTTHYSIENLLQDLKLQNRIHPTNHSKHNEISAYCIERLRKIYRESHSLHIKPEKIVELHKKHLENDLTTFEHVKKILRSLTTLRKHIQEYRYTHTNPIEQLARDNYTSCLRALNEYLAEQTENLSMEMLGNLNPEIPELLEILWFMTTKKPKQSTTSPFERIKLNTLYGRFLPTSSKEELDKRIDWVKNHKNQLTKNLSCGYNLSPQKEIEIAKSIDYHEKYQKELELQKAHTNSG